MSIIKLKTMEKIEYLQSQRAIKAAGIVALDRMNDAGMWPMMILLKAEVAEIDRQIDELLEL